MIAQVTNTLSADNLIVRLKSSFQTTEKNMRVDPATNSGAKSIRLSDCLMSGFAMFSLKYPSLLQFDKDRVLDNSHIENIKAMYGIGEVPSDTTVREKLDEVSPTLLRPSFVHLFSAAQRHKVLEKFEFFDGYYLMSGDGTGFFSSDSVHCDHCCEKNHKDGSTTYYHQMYCGAIVHPDMKQVIPLCLEPIMKEDGATKNDCERNASKRFLEALKKEHPKLKLIITEDALASNAPHIKTITDLGYQYILGVKPGDHKFLFNYLKENECSVYEFRDHNGSRHKYTFLNGVPLNESNQDLKVNYLHFEGPNEKGNYVEFSKITSFELNQDNVEKIMRGGRSRWKIENEVFITLKNQGYHFEHNFGHGYKYLSTIFAMLLMLAFLVDQLQAIGCPLFKAVTKKYGSLKTVWRKVTSIFDSYYVQKFADIYRVLTVRNKATLGDLLNDTS